MDKVVGAVTQSLDLERPLVRMSPSLAAVLEVGGKALSRIGEKGRDGDVTLGEAIEIIGGVIIEVRK